MRMRPDRLATGVMSGTLVVLIVAVAAATLTLAVLTIPNEQHAETYLARSIPYVGADIPQVGGERGGGGDGILIAIIDTGVDYGHPDMLGWQNGTGKVAGGWNLLSGGAADSLIDTDGHGTQVAGVASADGSLKGVAPKSKILAYKVSEAGEDVSSELIARAVIRAADDGADVINISMGVSKTDAVIERAINKVLARGVPVVVAAGNDGPDLATIGSPGRSHNSLTVGATHNNLTSSLVATFDAGGVPYTVVPMLGTETLSESINSRLVHAGYAKPSDFENIDVQNAIVVAERGSDIEGEMLYFSLKESHAADAGAAALIVYNNIDGLFLGELLHEFIEPGYEPRIPVISMSRDEGLELLGRMNNGTVSDAAVHLFHNPDFVAHFSSRGPVSPFYIKPDIVAPGAYINTTQAGSAYEIVSGTSYAAPHASGAAALLLQKNPDLEWPEIKSILMTTADAVMDTDDTIMSPHEAGSGRLNITKAYGANLVILPPSFVATVSDMVPVAEQRLELRHIGTGAVSNSEDVSVQFEGLPGFVYLDYEIAGDVLLLVIEIPHADSAYDPSATTPHTGQYGEYSGRMTLTYGNSEYAVPFLLHYTRGSVDASIVGTSTADHTDKTGTHLAFAVSHPDDWDFAKIDVIDSITEESVTVTATPQTIDTVRLEVREAGTYWIDARLTVQGEPYSAYDTIHVPSDLQDDGLEGRMASLDDSGRFELDHDSRNAFAASESLPLRQIVMVAVAVAALGATGVAIRMQNNRHSSSSSGAGSGSYDNDYV